MKMPGRWVSVAFAAVGAVSALAVEGAAPITNDDIVKLVEADVECRIIVTKIRSSDNAFDTSAEGLIALTTAGVNEAVVLEMIVSAKAPGPSMFLGTPKQACAAESGEQTDE